MCKNEECVDDVLVIYCAKHPTYNFTTVVGWYNHADVYRHYQNVEFNGDYVQSYNAIAKAKDCVLLPVGERSNGRCQEKQMDGSLALEEQMFGMQVKIMKI